MMMMMSSTPTHYQQLNQPLWDDSTQQALSEVCEAARFFEAQGWVPATSSNFSVRVASHPASLAISASGLNKGQLTPNDFLWVHPNARLCDAQHEQRRPSAETDLHGWVYQRYPAVQCVLHVHALPSVVFSLMAQQQAPPEQRQAFVTPLSQLELLKGLAGIETHDLTLPFPCVANSQAMPQLAQQVEDLFNGWQQEHWQTLPPLAPYGVLLVGHGLYAWGRTVSEARRHVESLLYLFEVNVRKKV
ncbi:MAG: methylthioribulose 1-phosphate dehydratase [Vampirovibrionales bacterium]